MKNIDGKHTDGLKTGRLYTGHLYTDRSYTERAYQVASRQRPARRLTGFSLWLLMPLMLVLTACTTTEPRLPPKTDQAISPNVLIDTYKMAVGDQIQINVWKNPELSLSEPIRPDGKISMPLVGDVMAAGLTPEQLSDELERRLADFVKAPNVTVILTSLQGHAFLSRIRITGSVTQNISIPYHQGMTVLDAILEAGSVDDFADANNTRLHRRTSKGTVVYDIRLDDIMKGGDMRSNVFLMPGDILTVPERSF